MDDVPRFKSTKRRKIARVRNVSPINDDKLPVEARQTVGDPSEGDHAVPDSNADEEGMTSVVRARKQMRRPIGGVQFSTAKPLREDVNSSSVTSMRDVPTEENIIDIGNRFVGSTGQVVHDDKHMVAFVDAEMARKRNTPVLGFHSQPLPAANDIDDDPEPRSGTLPPVEKTLAAGQVAPRQLSEIDLGTSAYDRNLARTQAALERVKAGQTPIDDEIKPPKPRKPRLGRDGKPFRPRPRKRRNSEDVARDALVEQFLHENKIDMYDTTEPQAGSKPETGNAGGDVDADERFAEQFRQDFMDAMAERKNKNKPAPQVKGAPATEVKGPKLGGSRSQRQKMAQIQQDQQQSQSAGKK